MATYDPDKIQKELAEALARGEIITDNLASRLTPEQLAKVPDDLLPPEYVAMRKLASMKQELKDSRSSEVTPETRANLLLEFNPIAQLTACLSLHNIQSPTTPISDKLSKKLEALIKRSNQIIPQFASTVSKITSLEKITELNLELPTLRMSIDDMKFILNLFIGLSIQDIMFLLAMMWTQQLINTQLSILSKFIQQLMLNKLIPTIEGQRKYEHPLIIEISPYFIELRKKKIGGYYNADDFDIAKLIKTFEEWRMNDELQPPTVVTVTCSSLTTKEHMDKVNGILELLENEFKTPRGVMGIKFVGCQSADLEKYSRYYEESMNPTLVPFSELDMGGGGGDSGGTKPITDLQDIIKKILEQMTLNKIKNNLTAKITGSNLDLGIGFNISLTASFFRRDNTDELLDNILRLGNYMIKFMNKIEERIGRVLTKDESVETVYGCTVNMSPDLIIALLMYSLFTGLSPMLLLLIMKMFKQNTEVGWDVTNVVYGGRRKTRKVKTSRRRNGHTGRKRRKSRKGRKSRKRRVRRMGRIVSRIKKT